MHGPQRRTRFGVTILALASTLTSLSYACLPASPHNETREREVVVYILAGQSNMEGKSKNELFDHQASAPETKASFAHLRDGDRWRVRDDVFVDFLGRRGPLTIGFGSPGRTGVELEFGHVIGEATEEPVLLIKAAWGGRALAREFRPVSAGLPSTEVLASELNRAKERAEKDGKDAASITLESVRRPYGSCYRDMIRTVRETLASMDERFPALAGRTPRLSGFVWFQGWNDLNDRDAGEYANNLAHLVRDVRRDLHAPGLPVVVAAMGQNGSKPASGPMKTIQDAQLGIASLEEFSGNVVSVATDELVDRAAEELFPRWKNETEAWERTGSDFPFHYLGSALWMTRIGKRAADAMLELCAGRKPERREGPDDKELEEHIGKLRERLADHELNGRFHILVEKPFVVLGDGGKAAVERSALATVRWSTDLLMRDYFPRVPASIHEVWLFKNKGSYEANTRKIFGDVPTTPFGYYTPHHRALIMNIATGGGTLVHEIVHPFMAANFEACPSWFNEGLGSLYEQCNERDGKIVGLTNWRLKGLQDAIRDQRTIPLERLVTTTRDEFYGQGSGLHYAMARYLCYWLQEHELLRRFYRTFVDRHANDPSGLATLKNVISTTDLAAFQTEWQAFVSGLRF